MQNWTREEKLGLPGEGGDLHWKEESCSQKKRMKGTEIEGGKGQ